MEQQTTAQDVEKYLSQKGFEFRKIGTQYSLITGCPLCKDEKPNHFYISEEGLWDCKKCGNKGNLYLLKKELGDITEKEYKPNYYKPQEKKVELKAKVKQQKITINRSEIEKYFEKMYIEKPEIVEYFLKKRGFTEKALNTFKLGWDGQNITIPIFEKGKLVNIRKRKNPLIQDDGKMPKYFSITGTEIGMFNTDSIKPDTRPVFITEGEFDAISLWVAGNGDVQVVSGTGGASSFKEEWAKKYFKGKQKIYICYDNDRPGFEGAEKVSKILGPQRCKIIALPSGIKDLNDFFTSGKKLNDFKQLIAQAKKPQCAGVDIIEPLSSVLNRVKEQMASGGDIFNGVNTGYADVDKILQRMRPGDLIILSGLTSMGKTFFAQNVIHKLARQNISVMFFSLEMTPEQAAERFIMIDSGINTDKFSGGVLSLDSTELVEVEESITRLSNFPVFFYNGEGDINKDGLEKISKIAVDQFGCQLIVVDHLHYFANNAEDTGEISALVRKAKIIAKDNDVPMMMISHVRKLESETKTPTISDLRNSSMIGQDADVVMMVHREKPNDPNPNEAGKTILHILKNRHGKRGQVVLDFDSDTCRFYELDRVHDDNEFRDATIVEPTPVQGELLKKEPDPTRYGYKDNE